MHIAYFSEWLTAEFCCGSTWMNANELIARAEDLCRHRRIRFPSDLRQYASQWQREDFDLRFCWHRVKPLLSAARPLWPAEVDIRNHHARLRDEKAARERAAGKPPVTSPTPDGER